MVTHPTTSTNWAQCRASALTETKSCHHQEKRNELASGSKYCSFQRRHHEQCPSSRWAVVLCHLHWRCCSDWGSVMTRLSAHPLAIAGTSPSCSQRSAPETSAIYSETSLPPTSSIMINKALRTVHSTQRHAVLAEYVWLTGFLCGWSVGFELVTWQFARSGHWLRQLQTSTLRRNYLFTAYWSIQHIRGFMMMHHIYQHFNSLTHLFLCS